MSIAAGADITAGRGAATHAASAAQFANNAIQAGNNATQSMSNATNRWFELWKQQDEQAARKQAMEIAEKEIGLKEKDQDLRAAQLDETKRQFDAQAGLRQAQAWSYNASANNAQQNANFTQNQNIAQNYENEARSLVYDLAQKGQELNAGDKLKLDNMLKAMGLYRYDPKNPKNNFTGVEFFAQNKQKYYEELAYAQNGIKGQYMQGENYAKNNQTPNELTADGGTYRFRNGNFTFSKNGKIDFIKNPNPKQAQILAQLQNQQSAFTRE